MVIGTRRLFAQLLSLLDINAVCDVGSMNGSDALMFRRVLSRARIYAFEPNPENFRMMQADPALPQAAIEVVPLAATNYDGDAEFFVVKADYSGPNHKRGMSSLYRRSSDWSELAAVVPVKTTRLDSFLADKTDPHMRLALWVDTEGKAFEAIEGAAGVAQHVQLLHVEVETLPCIGQGQKLYADVKALLRQSGFVVLATSAADTKAQFNALFVRHDLPLGTQRRMRTLLALAGLHHLAGVVIRSVCPDCARRVRAWVS
jgi:FkbM family methyltransferase